MAGYATPAWVNDAAPAINASALTAMGQALELSEHPYGVCSTAAATVAKAVTIDFSGALSLFEGLTIRVKFANGNTAQNPTLNVNGTGAVPIMRNGTTNAYMILAGQILALQYDGTNWLAVGNTENVVPLTTAQYNALSAAQKAADIVYVITDDETAASFQPLITANGVLMGDGAGGITAKTLDTSSLSADNNHIPTSGVVKSAISDLPDTSYSISVDSTYITTNYPMALRIGNMLFVQIFFLVKTDIPVSTIFARITRNGIAVTRGIGAGTQIVCGTTGNTRIGVDADGSLYTFDAIASQSRCSVCFLTTVS